MNLESIQKELEEKFLDRPILSQAEAIQYKNQLTEYLCKRFGVLPEQVTINLSDDYRFVNFCITVE